LALETIVRLNWDCSERQHDSNSIHQGGSDMTFWIILAIMVSAAAALLSAPFVRWPGRPVVESAGDIDVYRDLLKEIESKQRQGLIGDTEAEEARLETVRRALAADRVERPVMPKLVVSERNFSVICVSGIVVLGLVGLYAAKGNLDLPSTRGAVAAQPASALFSRDQSVPQNLVTAMQTFVSENQGQPQAKSDVPPVDEMIRRLAARLLQNPKDAQGWRTLGWSYLNIGQFFEASEAYAKAIELSPNDAEIRSARIEALVRSADGVVTADAKRAIEDTLKIDPQNGRARFFAGLAKEQEGDKTSALTDWREVLRDADPNESWVPDLKNRISELERVLGTDPAARTTGAAKPAVAGGSLETSRAPGGSPMAPAIEKGPSPQDVQAAEAMAPADRSAMIRGMVDRLASRLEKSPRDADGWIKLVQSRMVLGETELAKRALARGIEAFTDDTEQRDRIIAAAQQLGISK
jgi:cytochrome c-type biogenesis protein CcmH